jgi:hypothetical protein
MNDFDALRIKVRHIAPKQLAEALTRLVTSLAYLFSANGRFTPWDMPPRSNAIAS